MAFFTDVLKKFFGTKSDRDIKLIRPYVDKTIAAYDRIDKLTHDELRTESFRIKKIITDRIAADEEKKRSLRERLEDVMIDVKEKEELATEVDKLSKKIDENIEE